MRKRHFFSSRVSARKVLKLINAIQAGHGAKQDPTSAQKCVDVIAANKTP